MRKLLLCVLLLSGCARMQSLVTPYKIDIQQGNVLTPDLVAQIKPGLSRAQVESLLGTPLVDDPFHNDRLDYVYHMIKDGKSQGPTERLTVFFNGDSVDHVVTNVNTAAR